MTDELKHREVEALERIAVALEKIAGVSSAGGDQAPVFYAPRRPRRADLSPGLPEVGWIAVKAASHSDVMHVAYAELGPDGMPTLEPGSGCSSISFAGRWIDLRHSAPVDEVQRDAWCSRCKPKFEQLARTESS